MDALGVTYDEEQEWQGVVTIKLTFIRIDNMESSDPRSVVKPKNDTAKTFLKSFQDANKDVQEKCTFFWLIEEDTFCGTVPENIISIPNDNIMALLTPSLHNGVGGLLLQ